MAIKFPEYKDRRFCHDSFTIFDLCISGTVSSSLTFILVLVKCIYIAVNEEISGIRNLDTQNCAWGENPQSETHQS